MSLWVGFSPEAHFFPLFFSFLIHRHNNCYQFPLVNDNLWSWSTMWIRIQISTKSESIRTWFVHEPNNLVTGLPGFHIKSTHTTAIWTSKFPIFISYMNSVSLQEINWLFCSRHFSNCEQLLKWFSALHCWKTNRSQQTHESSVFLFNLHAAERHRVRVKKTCAFGTQMHNLLTVCADYITTLLNSNAQEILKVRHSAWVEYRTYPSCITSNSRLSRVNMTTV